MILDSYEQPRKRLTDYRKKKKYYSGKQKKPTLKNPIVVMPNGEEIVDVVVGEAGTTADMKIWNSRRKEWNPEHKF
ncbi:transposase family protein [Microcoleus sp. MON2_D5]|uniref:transposase family protein n=1 Tax=Microcoleus sp. MON2_D5 TaxID=2818833 RepID=UPI002FD1E6A8